MNLYVLAQEVLQVDDKQSRPPKHLKDLGLPTPTPADVEWACTVKPDSDVDVMRALVILLLASSTRHKDVLELLQLEHFMVVHMDQLDRLYDVLKG